MWRALAAVVVGLVVLPFAAGCTSFNGPTTSDGGASTLVATSQPTTPPRLGGTEVGGRRVGEVTVWLYSGSNPPARGKDTLEAVVTDAEGQPVSDATVSFDADMTNMSMGRNVATASSLGGGHYGGVISFGMSGPWRLIVHVEQPGADPAVRFDFDVR